MKGGKSRKKSENKGQGVTKDQVKHLPHTALYTEASHNFLLIFSVQNNGREL